jgi:hypothetical protein
VNFKRQELGYQVKDESDAKHIWFIKQLFLGGGIWYSFK